LSPFIESKQCVTQRCENRFWIRKEAYEQALTLLEVSEEEEIRQFIRRVAPRVVPIYLFVEESFLYFILSFSMKKSAQTPRNLSRNGSRGPQSWA